MADAVVTGADSVRHTGGGSGRGVLGSSGVAVTTTAQIAADSALAGTYAQVVALSGTGIDAAGAADSTTAINALLSANPGKVARGVPGASYLISAPLVLKSGTTLDMTGCTVTLAAGSNCNMLQNTQVVANNGRDSQIRVVGGLWDRGANTGTGTGNHSIVFRRLDGVSVIGARFASTAGKYAVNFGDVTDYLAADLSFNVASDGVHVQGPAARGTIRNLYGTCGDDMVGVTAVDYTAYADVSGNISDLRIDSIHGNNVGTLMVKVVGGTGTTVRRVSISNIFGTCLNYPVSITDDTTGATDVSEITVSGVYAVPSTPHPSPATSAAPQARRSRCGICTGPPRPRAPRSSASPARASSPT